jgi:hypothetical protein
MTAVQLQLCFLCILVHYRAELTQELTQPLLTARVTPLSTRAG